MLALRNGLISLLAVGCLLGLTVSAILFRWDECLPASTSTAEQQKPSRYRPRSRLETSGLGTIIAHLEPWAPDASLEAISEAYRNVPSRCLAMIDRHLAEASEPQINAILAKIGLLHATGDAVGAYRLLGETRARVEQPGRLGEEWLFTVIYYQGVTALRMGENDNCVLCRGESACILPLAPTAIHANRTGSTLAVRHFTEYLERFPDDLEVRWLLNLAQMTLGGHPHEVDPRYLLSLDAFRNSEFDIGKFRDVGHLVGVTRFNQAGGAILEDFDNDGLPDLVTTSWDATMPMAFYRNKGDGRFEDRSKAAGLSGQLGGLYCVQGDYNNDGHADVFVCRGAWLPHPIRPSLLRNNGDGTFTDVTREAGLPTPVNSISAAWADYDNDGFLDLFVCCENQANRLYRNKGDGTFEEVAGKARVEVGGRCCKGAAWIDFDNDGYPDLFLNNLGGAAQLFHNDRDGTFTEVTYNMGINGPESGFSCWAFDFDNDGWIDLFATCYDRTPADVVKGLLDQPHTRFTSRLYRNLEGKGFQDVTKAAGLDKVYAAMGSNFGDVDNDGYPDFYLATGEPNLGTLIPNRMFKNVAGKRFAEITASSGTGHLQKGHAVALGDWDRDGNLDVFVQTGGAVDGDRYHNVLFQNPGQGNHWLAVKLVGKKTNRGAVGARVKVVTAGADPLTVHQHVSSGSSFGANPLERHVGLGKADRVALLEVYWPTSGTTQTFRDLAADQVVEITEFAKDYRKLPHKPVPLPK